MDPLFALPFGVALSQNRAARDYYDSLNDEEKKEFIERTRAYRTEGELNSFFDSLLTPCGGMDS